MFPNDHRALPKLSRNVFLPAHIGHQFLVKLTKHPK
jgi:hypothetical protein